MVWGFIQSFVGTIAGAAQALLPSAMVMNQGRSLATQSKQLELLQKRDQGSQEIARERMAFDAQMEIRRQAIRAKERGEDKAFNLALKRMELVQMLRTEEMRQAFQSMESEKQRQFSERIEKFKAEVQIAINKDNLAFALWKEETGRQFALDMKLLDVQINRLLSKESRDNAKRDKSGPIAFLGLMRYNNSIELSPPRKTDEAIFPRPETKNH